MRVLRVSLALAGAVTVLGAIPAAAGAVTIPNVPQQFKAKIDGTAKLEWQRRRGPVGEDCKEWSTQDGLVSQRFSAKAAHFTLMSGTFIGIGVGAATISGSVDGTAANSLEPGCPALCPDATSAAFDRAHGPTARAADCAQKSFRRDESSVSCKAAARTPNSLFSFKGKSQLSLQVLVNAEGLSGPSTQCVQVGSGLPRVKLFTAKELRRLGGRKLKRRRTLTGRCPGTAQTPSQIRNLGTFKCTYKLQLTVTVSRL